MQSYSPVFFLVPFLVPVSVSAGLVSPVKCSSEKTACEVHDETLIESVGGVASREECRQLCYDSQQCQYITYFTSESFPFSEICSLFLSCEEVYTCRNCVSETRGCYQTCSDQLYGKIDENLVQVVADVDTEVDCKVLCGTSSDCGFYTYFLPSDLNTPRLCVLLSHLLDPLEVCDHCLTGPLQCQAASTTSSSTQPTTPSTTPSTTPLTTSSVMVDVPGVLITGGGDSRSEVEVYNPLTQHSCRLPDLPDLRHSHTLCGGLLCGGLQSARSCLAWEAHHHIFTTAEVTLLHERTGHLCWAEDSLGVRLMGGEESGNSTELVLSGGAASTADFNLKYIAE